MFPYKAASSRKFLHMLCFGRMSVIVRFVSYGPCCSLYGYFPSAESHSPLKVAENFGLIFCSNKNAGFNNPNDPAFHRNFSVPAFISGKMRTQRLDVQHRGRCQKAVPVERYYRFGRCRATTYLRFSSEKRPRSICPVWQSVNVIPS